MGSFGVMVLESGEGSACVSLDTGAVVSCASPSGRSPDDSRWRVLDRSPISARIVAGEGPHRVELRYELDGRRLTCERRAAGGDLEVTIVDMEARVPLEQRGMIRE